MSATSFISGVMGYSVMSAFIANDSEDAFKWALLCVACLVWLFANS